MKEKEELFSQELIKSIFDYNNGHLYWKIKYSRKVIVGKQAGYRNPKDNREVICLSGNMFFTYRLIFFYFNGWWPEEIDHADRNPANNKIENLRPATRSQNKINRRSRIGSSSKYLGVNFDKRSKKWVSRIRINGKSTQIGSFKEENLAALTWNRFAVKYYGEFANLNIIK